MCLKNCEEERKNIRNDIILEFWKLEQWSEPKNSIKAYSSDKLCDIW